MLMQHLSNRVEPSPLSQSLVLSRTKELFSLQGLVRTCSVLSATAYHSGKLGLAFTSPKFISTSPKNVLISRIDYTVLL